MLQRVVGAVMLIVGVVFIARDSGLELVELPIDYQPRALLRTYCSCGTFFSGNCHGSELHLRSVCSSNRSSRTSRLSGVLFIIMGVVVFLIGHALNMALGILGGGLHSIRLHYVEFFTKFYKGGGRKYSPLGLNRRFTED